MAKRISDQLAELAEEAETKRDQMPVGRMRRRRAPRDPAQVYSVRMPADSLDELRRLAEAHHETPSGLIREWVLSRLEYERAKGASEDLAEITSALALVAERLPEISERWQEVVRTAPGAKRGGRAGA